MKTFEESIATAMEWREDAINKEYMRCVPLGTYQNQRNF